MPCYHCADPMSVHQVEVDECNALCEQELRLLHIRGELPHDGPSVRAAPGSVRIVRATPYVFSHIKSAEQPHVYVASSDVDAAQHCVMDFEVTHLKLADGECDSDDQELEADTLEACAAACIALDGCTYFSFAPCKWEDTDGCANFQATGASFYTVVAPQDLRLSPTAYVRRTQRGCHGEPRLAGAHYRR